MKKDPEKQTKKSNWWKNVDNWMGDHIYVPVMDVLINVIEWFAEHATNIIITILCIALPGSCIFGIVKVANRDQQEIIAKDKELGMQHLDPTRPDLKFYPVKIAGHDYWKYYSEGTQYIHSPECEMCCKEIDKDTILIISGR